MNGKLTRDPEHGYVWTTKRNKCGDTKRVKVGNVTMEQARKVVADIDGVPMECPNGFHVELGGWRKLWNLDDMIAAYEAELNLSKPKEHVA